MDDRMLLALLVLVALAATNTGNGGGVAEALFEKRWLGTSESRFGKNPLFASPFDGDKLIFDKRLWEKRLWEKRGNTTTTITFTHRHSCYTE